MDLGKPRIMGILNLTPDSFYVGSRINIDRLVERAGSMIEEGVDILDVGAYSSRPGAEDVSQVEELDRLIPGLEILVKAFPDFPISIDTFRSKTAEECLRIGASMINDISGGGLDPEMIEVVKRARVPYVAMHMKGNPQTMKGLTDYDDLLLEVVQELQKKVYHLNLEGVADIIVDPGFGFAKSIEQNFLLLKNLRELEILERPVLVGISRKSMIYKSLKVDVGRSLHGTTAAQVLALINGANILRVHDVAAAADSIKIFELYKDATSI